MGGHDVRSRALFVGLATLALPAAAPAQAPVTEGACTYSICALRVENGWLGQRIVQGAAGTPATTPGKRRLNLADFVKTSDSAAFHARAFKRDHDASNVLALVGVGLFVAAIAQADPWSANNSSSVAPLYYGSLAFALASGGLRYRADRSLSRAVWWYNRDLPRP